MTSSIERNRQRIAEHRVHLDYPHIRKGLHYFTYRSFADMTDAPARINKLNCLFAKAIAKMPANLQSDETTRDRVADEVIYRLRRQSKSIGNAIIFILLAAAFAGMLYANIN
jgi:hypothetical protein